MNKQTSVDFLIIFNTALFNFFCSLINHKQLVYACWYTSLQLVGSNKLLYCLRFLFV